MIIYIFLYILNLRLDTGAVFCYNGIYVVMHIAFLIT